MANIDIDEAVEISEEHVQCGLKDRENFAKETTQLFKILVFAEILLILKHTPPGTLGQLKTHKELVTFKGPERDNFSKVNLFIRTKRENLLNKK